MASPRLVHVLIPELTDQNIRAFVAPLIASGRLLSEAGFSFRFHHQVTPSLTECDVLALCSSYWRGPWERHRDRALEQFAEWSRQVPLMLYFDRSSTSGTVLPDVLPYVRRYYKTNLLRDRAHYRRPLYGLRLFADHYHRTYGVKDAEPASSWVIDDADQLAKLRPSWSTALADYSLFGPRKSALYRYLPWSGLMTAAERFHRPEAVRPVDVSCRMGMRYKYDSVAYQRQQMARVLERYKRNDRVSKARYFKELRDSKIVASPFGYSEVNYKDFETFLSGALLLKPDMSHLETWPDLYEDGVSYVAHKWDLSDVNDQIDSLLADDARRVAIARAGQERYRKATAGPAAREAFAGYLTRLLQEAEATMTPGTSSSSPTPSRGAAR